MSIPLTGTGGIFTRLGKIGALLNAIDSHIGTGSLSVSSLVGSAGTVTVTTLKAHGYTTGDTVVIAGASPSGFNGTETITVTGNTTFTYSNATTGTATGTITATKTGGVGVFSVGPYVDNVFAQFLSVDQNLVSALYSSRDTYRTVHNTFLAYLQTLAQNTVVQMAADDAPQPSSSLTNALSYLLGQLKTGIQSVPKPTVSASTSAGSSNAGGGVVAASVIGSNGLQRDYVFAESILLTCTADGQGSGGTAGQETFSVITPVAETNELLWDWPSGSGVNATLNAVDATVDAASGNVLQNGAFKTWTNPTVGPDNWLITVGTVGTNINQASGSSVYKGSSGLDLVGDGSTLLQINQPFAATTSTAGNTGGSPISLAPSTVYALSAFYKVSAVPASGQLEISLTDGSGNITTDAAGTQNVVTIDLTAASTSLWKNATAFFRTPAVIPSNGFRLRVRVPSGHAISAGTTAHFGHMAMNAASQVYAGGPYLTVFSGNPNFVLGDNLTVTVSNNYSSQWQLLLERLFSLRSLGLAFPSSGSPTIADSLIA